MLLYYVLGDDDKAFEFFHDSMGILEASVVYKSQPFYFALISIEIQRQKGKIGQKSEAKKYIDVIKQLMEGDAMNLCHKYLLQAEMTSLTSKDTEQTTKIHEQAVVCSTRAGFLQDGGTIKYALCTVFRARAQFER